MRQALLLIMLFSMNLFSTMAQDSLTSSKPLSSLFEIMMSQDINMGIKEPFEVRNGKVYYVHVIDIGSSRSILRKFWEETELDTTFVIVGDIYAKDNLMVYRMSKKLPGADPQSFTVVNGQYSKDARSVYYNDSLILNADPETFELIEKKDGDERSNPFHLAPLAPYSKDKNHAYLEGVMIPDSDPETFEVITYPYSKDKNRIYIFKDTIDADVKSFQVIADIFSKDTSSVFYDGQKIRGADPNTIRIVSNVYSKDARHVFYKNLMIPLADPGTFRYSGPYSYAEDDRHIFYNAMLVEGIDVKTASYPMADFIKDKYSLFYEGIKIEGVDMSAFEIDYHEGAAFVYDKQFIYYMGQRERIDLKSFNTHANVRPPMDKDYIYLLGKDGIQKIENNKKNRKENNIHDSEGFNPLLRK